MAWSFKRPSIPKKYQQWLKENRWWIQLVAIAVITMIVVIAFKKGTWSDWVGFKGKTVWNWLELLGIPVVLAILGYGLQQQQQKRAEVLSQKQREIAADEAKEEILQAYFDRLSTLLIDKNILAIAAKVYSPEGEQAETFPQATPEEKELLDAAIDVIRARTLSILRRLEGDGDKKTSVVRFLIDANVISKARLSLSGVDLSGANLSRTELYGADFSGANLKGAYLQFANLRNANFGSANLEGANLGMAYLRGANFADSQNFGCKTNLSNAQLNGTDLRFVNFSFSILRNADLRYADLQNADFRYANLQDADLQAIIWNRETRWFKPEVLKAKNVPEALKQELGITDETK